MTSRAEAYRLLVADVYDLAGASRRTSETIARHHAQSSARWNLLSVVDHGALSVASAARRLGQARQSVQRVADALRRDGLITIREDPGDRRAPLIESTRSGREVLRRLTDDADADRGRQLEAAGLETDELMAARLVLRRLRRALDET